MVQFGVPRLLPVLSTATKPKLRHSRWQPGQQWNKDNQIHVAVKTQGAALLHAAIC
jgi:hypothetical protein